MKVEIFSIPLRKYFILVIHSKLFEFSVQLYKKYNFNLNIYNKIPKQQLKTTIEPVVSMKKVVSTFLNSVNMESEL